MQCPSCGIEMKRVVYDKNGKIYWHCVNCLWTEETKDLAPPFYDDWEVKDED